MLSFAAVRVKDGVCAQRKLPAQNASLLVHNETLDFHSRDSTRTRLRGVGMLDMDSLMYVQVCHSKNS